MAMLRQLRLALLLKGVEIPPQQPKGCLSDCNRTLVRQTAAQLDGLSALA